MTMICRAGNIPDSVIEHQLIVGTFPVMSFMSTRTEGTRAKRNLGLDISNKERAVVDEVNR